MAREYRVRRIGDFLKELHLTEGRGTGFPTIYDAMENNGAPAPVFGTDDQTYVLVTLRAHELFGVGAQRDVQGVNRNSDQASGQVELLTVSTLVDILPYVYQASDQARKIISEQIHSKVIDLLEATQEWTKRKDLFEKLDLSNHTTNRARYLDSLISFGWIVMEFPDTPNQRYKITDTGRKVLSLLDIR